MTIALWSAAILMTLETVLAVALLPNTASRVGAFLLNGFVAGVLWAVIFS